MKREQPEMEPAPWAREALESLTHTREELIVEINKRRQQENNQMDNEQPTGPNVGSEWVKTKAADAAISERDAEIDQLKELIRAGRIINEETAIINEQELNNWKKSYHEQQYKTTDQHLANRELWQKNRTLRKKTEALREALESLHHHCGRVFDDCHKLAAYEAGIVLEETK